MRLDENIEVLLQQLEGLSWMPWIGSNYGNTPEGQRILFIGESHYFNNPKEEDNYVNKNITRAIVKDMGVDGNRYGSPFFDNILRLIFKRSDLSIEERQKFWRDISFYNFVQRPMVTKKGRPTKIDYELGWKVFYELIKIIKPTTCIFLGITAGNFYKEGSKYKGNLTLSNYKWGDTMFGRSRSIHLEFNDLENNITNLYFVQHPSSFFSPSKCREFLLLKEPKVLEYFNNLIH